MRAARKPVARPQGRSLRLLIAGIGFVLALGFIIAGVRHFNMRSRPGEVAAGPGQITRSVVLHFLDASGRLESEVREVAGKATLAAQVEAVLAEELAGSMSDLEPAIPPGTRLLHVFVGPGSNITLDLSREIVRNQPGDVEREYATLAALVRTVRLNFTEITTLQILIEGQPEPTLAGHFAIAGPLVADDWVHDGAGD